MIHVDITRQPPIHVYHVYRTCITSNHVISDSNRSSRASAPRICESCVLVEEATVPGQCIPCVANPCNLIYRCKGGRKTGICYHILFVTHMIMKDDPNPDNQKRTYNLNYMNSKVAGARRDGKKGRPKRIKHCLMNEDSSDEDDAQLALTW